MKIQRVPFDQLIKAAVPNKVIILLGARRLSATALAVLLALGGHAEYGSGSSKHFCRFNQAYRINAGHFGIIRLDGAKFWFAGDAGEDFARPKHSSLGARMGS